MTPTQPKRAYKPRPRTTKQGLRSVCVTLQEHLLARKLRKWVYNAEQRIALIREIIARHDDLVLKGAVKVWAVYSRGRRFGESSQLLVTDNQAQIVQWALVRYGSLAVCVTDVFHPPAKEKRKPR